MELRENAVFLREFVINPVSVSSVLPSSGRLAKKMTEVCSIDKADVIVELGCGSGAITKSIVKHSQKKTKILSFDINEELLEIVKNRFPSVIAINDYAENLEQHLRNLSINKVDIVISSLPWAVFKESLRERLLNIIIKSLKNKGEFVAFSYLHAIHLGGGRNFRKSLFSRFSSVFISRPVWFNIPPAVVYSCMK